MACERNSAMAFPIVQILLNLNKQSRLAVDKKKNMPIHLAIQSENIPIIQLLLQRDAEQQVCFADIDGNTPFHLAAKQRINFKKFFNCFYLFTKKSD